MYTVSDAFLRTLTGSHQAVFEARLLLDYDDGPDPDGIEIPILSGDVQMQTESDVRSTLSLTTPGRDRSWRRWWPRGRDTRMAPWGSEIFVRRGVDMGGGGIEWVPLGYFRIDDIEQADAPDGDITITGSDRMATIIDSRLIEPRWFGSRDTVGDILGQLIFEVYPQATILFDDFTYLEAIYRNTTFEESRFDAINETVAALGKICFWDREGFFRVVEPPDLTQHVWDLEAGKGGVLVEPARHIGRDGVINAMVVRGEAQDDEEPIQAVATINDANNPLVYGGRFGRVPRFFASPMITTQAQANRNAINMLNRYIGFTYTVDFGAICNPALDPGDPIRVRFKSRERELHTIDSITIPLVAEANMTGSTRDATYRRPNVPPPDPTCNPPFWVGSTHAYDFEGVEPNGVMEGDLLIAVAGNDGEHMIGPTGWTQIGLSRNAGSFDTHVRVWIIERGATTPDLTWTVAGSYDFPFVHIGAWRNAWFQYVDVATGSTGSPIAPSVTSTGQRQLLVALYADSAWGGTAVPGNMNDRSVQPYNFHTSLLADENIGVVGPTGDREFFGTDPVAAWALLLQPLCDEEPEPPAPPENPTFIDSTMTIGNEGTMPSGAQEGDVLVAIVGNDDGVLSASMEWTQIANDLTGGAFNTTVALYITEIGVSPPDLEFTGSLQDPTVGLLLFRGASATTVDEDESAAGSAVAPSVTGSAADQLLVCVCADSAWIAGDEPAGMTAILLSGQAVAAVETVGAGATGTRTFTDFSSPVGAWSFILGSA